MLAEVLRPFTGKKYLNLESYRRDGRAVRTPLWFVEMNDRLWISTPDDAGKIKRIRRNARVRIALCDIRGRVEGDWIEAEARFAQPEEAERVHRLLVRKYGLAKRLIDLGTWLRRRGHVIIGIEARPAELCTISI